MHPPDHTFSDLYSRRNLHQTSQSYSYFPTQNPIPYPLHHHQHLPIEPHFTTAVTDPDPPSVPAYLYSLIHAGGAYESHHAGGGLTYSHAVDSAPPPTYVSELVTQNWAAEKPAQQYGNTLYPLDATVHQNVTQQLLPTIPTHNTWTNTNPIIQSQGQIKKIPQKTKISQSVWCQICKIACNRGDVLYKHKMGKKHIKNIEKLLSAASVATTSTTINNPVIGPLEKPNKGNFGIKKVETPQDLEIKKLKVLQGGAAANAVRTCTICNVVCNSDTVFRFHLAGQKHTSMVKSLQLPGIV